MMNIYQVFAMNRAQYGTWCYIMSCHDGFSSLEELDAIIPLEQEEIDIRDETWAYVCDIHEPDEIWWSLL